MLQLQDDRKVRKARQNKPWCKKLKSSDPVQDAVLRQRMPPYVSIAVLANRGDLQLIESASALMNGAALLQLQDSKKVDNMRQIKPPRRKVRTTTPPEGAVLQQRKAPAPDEGIISDVGALSALARQGRTPSHSSQLPLRKKALPGRFPL